ncbi:hypothetical protein LEP1GSC132_0632 [Leptospira kirschneri str. 200803703]|uniref:STAS domain-containing protein n=1 Tax=Leptospira kirschneri str. 200802841 TaxID=1193047 RepID=A0A828Y1C9_9LEPT|nr:hypothetical protein [Leptospira kirschneri]EKO53818.1 hypothetical protein LEP1GSC131_3202 [Leptospira kirschneri str. 200802841]EMK16459.1 hypothetical protein LEP1GSC042_0481 [Leptospira kirschneri serovar Bim str. PUO 1247]EMN06037.1 hypothetical protein LEP1GSC046_0311 [Leptospira kirschneri serovar Bim str. 1051]EMO66157.1 hypothetical protein LEP1GSC132_0632 [Leptospira kirschneri str. 200803703]EMO79612.1 hypothetical protein LEP1GSC126_0963 [Leptospira kirschneri str. 200801774]
MLIKLSGVVDNRSILNVRDIILSILEEFIGLYILNLNGIENEEFINLTNFRKMLSDSIRMNHKCIIFSESKKLELWIENYSIFNGIYLVKNDTELTRVLNEKVVRDDFIESSNDESDIRLHLDYLIKDGY